jgi:hypothetical protein
MSPQVNPNAPITGWTIEYQQPMTGLGPDGRAVEGMKVGFVTGAGVHAYVFIPGAQYSAVNVRAAIAAKAAEIDTVHKLTG